MSACYVTPDPDEIQHASCAALDGKAVLIRGTSGRGKSALTLELLALGASLVSDDQTCLIRRPRGVVAYAPDTLLGLIEARGIGILNADFAPPTSLTLVIDLDKIETVRLPIARFCDVLGQSLPLLHKVDGPHFAAAVLQYLRAGLWTPK